MNQGKLNCQPVTHQTPQDPIRGNQLQLLPLLTQKHLLGTRVTASCLPQHSRTLHSFLSAPAQAPPLVPVHRARWTSLGFSQLS